MLYEWAGVKARARENEFTTEQLKKLIGVPTLTLQYSHSWTVTFLTV